MAKSRAKTRKKGNAVARYLRETSAELSKVNWPTREEALRLTGIVLVVVFTMSALLGFLDFLFSQLFRFIIGLA